MSTPYGRLVPGWRLEAAMTNTLKTWLYPTYTAAVEREEGLDYRLPEINTWSRRSWFSQLVGDEFLPLVVVVVPGTSNSPLKNGKREYAATWRMDVGIVVTEPEEPRRLASYMAAAIRLCAIQKGLTGFGLDDAEVDWIGERADDLPIEADRNLAVGRVQFEVKVRSVATASNGPAAPIPDPSEAPGELPRVETSNIRVHPKED